MPWKKTPSELIEFLDKIMAEFDCQKKTMFGYPAYFINNNMFAGAYEDNLFLRLSDDAREEILTFENEVSHFEPMSGRTMKEYVVLFSSFYKDRTKFIKWLSRSYDYVSSLPPKELKRKKKK